MRPLSLRARIVVLVLLVGLAPLAALGYWLSERTARTGEAVLRERLRGALVEQRAGLEQEWVLYRSRLLDLTELPTVAGALRQQRLPLEPPAELRQAFLAMDLSLESIRLRSGGDEWLLDRGARTPSAFGLPLAVTLPLFEPLTGDSIGALVAAVSIAALRGQTPAPVAGALLTALDPVTGAVLTPVALDRTALGSPAFVRDGEPWVAESLDGASPPVRLVAAAPLDPFASPFRDEARRGVAALVAVVLLGLALALLLSRRLTASLQELADGAAAVAAGDLSRTVPVRGDDEVARVGVAFNTMTDDLRRTLDQLAERESLAAVNEFAAALAHEIRNPLTAIQLDLQEVEERLADPELRSLQGQALTDLRKLDRTVGGALETARSGRIAPRAMDLMDAVRGAARAARPILEDLGAELRTGEPDRKATVFGDADALERVFLNLILNGAAAAGSGGTVTLEVEADGRHVRAFVSDTGPGIPDDRADRIFEPFFTTRPGGTGIGLAVARRIAAAHRGALDLVPSHRGARFRLTLPRP